MATIERHNRSPKDVLPTHHAEPALNKHRLSPIIDMVGNVRVKEAGFHSEALLSWALKCFLSQCASGEGTWGGE